jgi:hypothetical protein
MFVPGKTFQPSLMFAGKAGAYQSEAPFTAIHFHPSLIFAGKASTKLGASYEPER